jgi:hypothetical protein
MQIYAHDTLRARRRYSDLGHMPNHSYACENRCRLLMKPAVALANAVCDATGAVVMVIEGDRTNFDTPPQSWLSPSSLCLVTHVHSPLMHSRMPICSTLKSHLKNCKKQHATFRRITRRVPLPVRVEI